MNKKIRFVELQELCNSITDCHHSTPLYIESGKIVIRNFNIKNGRLQLDDISYTDEENYLIRTSRSIPEAGDLIITREAPMGEVCIIPENLECCLGQRMVLLKPNHNKVDSNYLLYTLMSQYVQTQISKSEGTGSIVSNLRIPVLKELHIPIYDIERQTTIGKILSDIDSKIALNNRINAELEAMAKTVYDYWFVQFDFPNAEGKPYKSSGGKMVWNEKLKREVPDGWEATTIASLLSLEGKSTIKIPSSEILLDGSIPVVDQSVDYIAGYTNNMDSIIKTDEPRIVFGDHTRILKFINFDFARGADGTQVLLSNNKRMPQHLFYHSLLKIDLSNYGYARHFKFLKEATTILPDEEVANKFEVLAKSNYLMIRDNILQNQQLSSLRDWLLPMLMNGQVRPMDIFE